MLFNIFINNLDSGRDKQCVSKFADGSKFEIS